MNSANHSFEWVDGSELSFKGWNDAEPSNSGPIMRKTALKLTTLDGTTKTATITTFPTLWQEIESLKTKLKVAFASLEK